jgi:hypothetical protein
MTVCGLLVLRVYAVDRVAAPRCIAPCALFSKHTDETVRSLEPIREHIEHGADASGP